MAEGAWVPAFDSLWTSQKTARLAKELRTSTDVAGAKFLRLMAWMRDHRPNGELGPADRATMARAIGLAGDTTRDADAADRGERFYQALVRATFLTPDERGFVRGWKDGPGRIVDRREADRLRKEHTSLTNPHMGYVQGCPKCRDLFSQGKPIAAGVPAAVSSGTAAPIRRNSAGTEEAFRRNSDRENRENRENREPPPPTRSVDRTGPRGPAEQAAPVTYPLEGAAREERLAELLVPLATAPDDETRQMLEELAVRMTTTNFLTFFQKARLERTTIGAVVRLPNGFVRDFVEAKFRPLFAQVLELPVGAVLFLVEGEAVSAPVGPVEAAVGAAAERGEGVPARTEGPQEEEAPSPREREFRAGSGGSGEAAGA